MRISKVNAATVRQAIRNANAKDSTGNLILNRDEHPFYTLRVRDSHGKYARRGFTCSIVSSARSTVMCVGWWRYRSASITSTSKSSSSGYVSGGMLDMGEQRIVDTEGRVERLRRRFNLR